MLVQDATLPCYPKPIYYNVSDSCTSSSTTTRNTTRSVDRTCTFHYLHHWCRDWHGSSCISWCIRALNTTMSNKARQWDYRTSNRRNIDCRYDFTVDYFPLPIRSLMCRPLRKISCPARTSKRVIPTTRIASIPGICIFCRSSVGNSDRKTIHVHVHSYRTAPGSSSQFNPIESPISGRTVQNLRVLIYGWHVG